MRRFQISFACGLMQQDVLDTHYGEQGWQPGIRANPCSGKGCQLAASIAATNVCA